MANLKYDPGKHLLKRLCAEAFKKADTFNAQNIANTLNALNTLDHNPGENLLRRLCAEALKKAESFNSQDIANTLNAAANLDHNPGEEVLRRLWEEALKKAESFNAQNIANTLNALAKLDHNPGEEVHMIEDHGRTPLGLLGDNSQADSASEPEPESACPRSHLRPITLGMRWRLSHTHVARILSRHDSRR
eukprot:g44594.t1